MHQFVTRSEGRRDCLQKWYFCATICCFRESILVALEIKNLAFAFISLGGIDSSNIRREKMCKSAGVASISWVKKNGPSINTGPF